jgi:L-2-hydroxyglutarate oxidase
MVHDYCVIGGGIVGLATAMKLLELQPGASMALLEKEAVLAQHQTGHNSGVIHAGIYYAPGSQKAEFCRRGSRATKRFCTEQGVPFKTCGKILVATNELELRRMDALFERARTNEIRVDWVDATGLRRLEPNITGLGALFVLDTAIVDYKLVCESMAAIVRKAGGVIETGVTVQAITEKNQSVVIASAGREWQAAKLIVCAGLQSDRLARMAGIQTDHQIVPFRGEYYRLPSSRSGIVQHLIYPIPDPGLPFLGVHLTPMIDGSITVGPNAVLGFAREGYPKFSFDLRDIYDYVSFPGFWKVIGRNLGHGMKEMKNSIFKAGYLKECRKYCPCLTQEDMLPCEAGPRTEFVQVKRGPMKQRMKCQRNVVGLLVTFRRGCWAPSLGRERPL